MSKFLFVYENMQEMGELQCFFDEKELFHHIDGNDTVFKEEYLNKLFTHFGIAVKRVTDLNLSQITSLHKKLEELGFEISVEEKNKKAKKEVLEVIQNS